MDLKTFASAVIEIAEERGVPQEKVIEVIEAALASAYKKEYGKKKQKIIAKLNPKTGEVKFWQVKQVVSEDMILSEKELKELKEKKKQPEKEEEKKIRFNPERHILIEEAQKIDPKIKVGEDLKIPLEPKEDFGRIAAQTAKQVILQKIKEAEKEETYKEYKEKEGEIVSGIVQRVEKNAVFLDIGRTSGILPKKEQVPGEFYRPGQRLKLYVLKTEQTPKGPQVILSRAYPKLISKLFELEVPEISAGQVVIKSIAREAGSRTKIAVTATEEGIDPIGSLVGQRGTRILAVINELGGEKIDVIEWSEDPKKYIANALSPAKVLEVNILPKNKAQAIVPDDQLSLAIGKEGQNVRLAAKLTGWKIDVRSVSQVEEKKIKEEKENEEEKEKEEETSKNK
jgi:N utilization substance protein A